MRTFNDKSTETNDTLKHKLNGGHIGFQNDVRYRFTYMYMVNGFVANMGLVLLCRRGLYIYALELCYLYECQGQTCCLSC